MANGEQQRQEQDSAHDLLDLLARRDPRDAVPWPLTPAGRAAANLQQAWQHLGALGLRREAARG